MAPTDTADIEATLSNVRLFQDLDPKYIAQALRKAGVTYKITNERNDPKKMVAQADSCVAGAAKGAIVVEIAADRQSASPGDAITYAVEVQNVGTTAACSSKATVSARPSSQRVRRLRGIVEPSFSRRWGGHRPGAFRDRS